MKNALKFFPVFLFFLFTITAYAQADTTSVQPDDEMNVFLLTVATIFIGALLGAAIVGAFVAAFVLLLIFVTTAFGLLSTAVFIGLYKRSLSAGFKSFLMLLFGVGCSVLGLAGILVFNHFTSLHLSTLSLWVVGLIAGLLGGMLLGAMCFALLKTILSRLAKKFRSI